MRIPTTIAIWVFGLTIGMLPSDRGLAASAAAQQAAPGGTWTANGRSACKTFLTADFLAAVLAHPAGESQRPQDGQSCSFAVNGSGLTMITIELNDHIMAADWDRFTRENSQPVSGVGDRAVRRENALYAYKNGGRTCSVMLIALEDPPKLTGEALAKKFGVICNQLFALP